MSNFASCCERERWEKGRRVYLCVLTPAPPPKKKGYILCLHSFGDSGLMMFIILCHLLILFLFLIFVLVLVLDKRFSTLLSELQVIDTKDTKEKWKLVTYKTISLFLWNLKKNIEETTKLMYSVWCATGGKHILYYPPPPSFRKSL